MAVRKSLGLLLILALGACAQLTAERPLFSVADQGPPPLIEGIWIGLGEGCAEHNLRRRRFASECTPLDIRREADGAWRVSLRVDLISDLTTAERAEEAEKAQNGPYRLILAPAVERDIGDGYAPIYLGELALLSAETSSVSYAVVAPTGSMPATEMRFLAMIGCDDILREGTIEGIAPQYEPRTDEQGRPIGEELVGCTAFTQTAVREAARRAVIENLDDVTERRFVFVRAN